MRQLQLLVLAISACAIGARGQGPTVASTLDREIGTLEKNLLALAEAMPEDKYNFTPAALNIPGSDFKTVRTFAIQVRHTAASNYAIWSRVTGEKFPQDFMGGDGPENFKTKAEVLGFLKDSFAVGHKAAASLTQENMLENIGNSTRLRLVVFGITHAMDHFGQMVEYLRMNGIVPPDSRP